MLKILNFASFASIIYMIGLSVLITSLKIKSQYYVILQVFAIIFLTFSITTMFILGIILFKKAEKCNSKITMKVTSVFFMLGSIFGLIIFFICMYSSSKVNPYL